MNKLCSFFNEASSRPWYLFSTTVKYPAVKKRTLADWCFILLYLDFIWNNWLFIVTYIYAASTCNTYFSFVDRTCFVKKRICNAFRTKSRLLYKCAVYKHNSYKYRNVEHKGARAFASQICSENQVFKESPSSHIYILCINYVDFVSRFCSNYTRTFISVLTRFSMNIVHLSYKLQHNILQYNCLSFPALYR